MEERWGCVNEAEKKVYRVEGFTCINCAGKFERNVKELEGVHEARVNFGAAKISVYGEATLEQLEKAGAFEQLKLTPEHETRAEVERTTPLSFLKKHIHVFISAIFLVLGIIGQSMLGEGNGAVIAAFLVAIVVGGYSLFKVGLANLMKAQFDMKTLMTIAVIGAAIIGEWTEGAIVVILFAISEALERFSMDQARQSIRSLMDIAPKEALIQRNGETVLVSVDDIQIGDRMIVRPGQKIAMDGTVVSGRSSVNQAAITGESVPVEKHAADEVFAGTLNEEGLLEVEVTKRVEDTTISKIIHLVEEAQAERAPSQAFIDKFAKYYTPAIMLVALFIALIPPLFFQASWETWIYQGLAVLVVGCPCALVISTPVAIVTAIGNAARNGVLIKGGVYLEELGGLKAIAFDKTGTLTKGSPHVTDLITCDKDYTDKEALAAIAALESRSAHPLASAVIRKADEEQVPYHEVEVNDFVSLTGKGIKGSIDGVTYQIGNLLLFPEASAEIKEEVFRLQRQGKTVMLFGTEKEVFALFAVADEVRELSKTVVERLHQLGISRTVMLTGDNWLTAEAVGRQVGVKEIQAELLPEDKLAYMKQLRNEHERVAMIGDGVNDAPALAASTVGIAMGGAGTDTALETADVALMSDDLKQLPYLISLSRKALRIIKQNIAFSLGLKLLALLLVVPGWLTLWIAILADMGATLLVTGNGLRLLNRKKNSDQI
ncbi:heavy metal translocating P-type ATPase [Halalkalibacter oceani]|uniref:heavy metal translocating P-type ATPase n=1 Tax=Halalkalibacter oceani TaxID=1653776 RepID=UPI003D817808